MWLRFDPEATAELDAAMAWYENQRLGLGHDLLSAVRDAFAAIQRSPGVGTPVAARLRSRRVLVKRFPYSVIYIAERESILVLAVAHHAKRPGYWRHRRG